MVGKPNLPDTGDGRIDLAGAARPTPGLSALDQEREASMADEGGVSGAVVESETGHVPFLHDPERARRRRLRQRFVMGFAAGAAAAVAAFVYDRWMRA
jgi:hypothetical protein